MVKIKKTQSGGGVVINAEGKVLVVNQNHRSWSLPKGHIEDGEDPLTAAKREIAEESGVTQLELVRKLGSYQRYRLNKDGGNDKTEMKTIKMFLFTTSQTDLAPTDPLNPEARWIEPAEVIDLLTHAKDREFFRKVMRLYL